MKRSAAVNGWKSPAWRICRIEIGDVRSAVVERACVQGHAGAAGEIRAEDESSLGRKGRTQRIGHVATGGVRVRKGRARPVGCLDAPFVPVTGAQHEMGPAVAGAPLQACFGGFAVARAEIAARLQVGPESAEFPVGDDVDDPADRVGAVDCGGTVLQDLHAVDHVVRDRIEIDVTWYSGGRSAGDPAPSIDQHQRTF